jgi:hypothetical protein
MGWTRAQDLRSCPLDQGPRTHSGCLTSVWLRGFVQNLRRGHYELGIEEHTTLRVMAAFTELTRAI